MFKNKMRRVMHKEPPVDQRRVSKVRKVTEKRGERWPTQKREMSCTGWGWGAASSVEQRRQLLLLPAVLLTELLAGISDSTVL